MIRTLLFLMAALVPAASAPALTISLGSSAKATAENVLVYRQSETTALVHDGRPEFGLDVSSVARPPLEAVQSVGIRIVRVKLDWGRMEPSEKPGLYDSAYLSALDQLVSSCRADGLCLCAAITGQPAGVAAGDVKALRERLAGFAGDMAGRYPSVLYWELSPILNQRDGVAETAGGSFADVLKAVYPRIKAVNPTASVVAACDGEPAFITGMLDNGARNCFDAAEVVSSPEAFADTIKAVRKLFSIYSDDAKPLWCRMDISGDVGKSEPETLRKALELNASQHLCDRLIGSVGEVFTSSSPLMGWLSVSKINAGITSRPRGTANVFVACRTPMIPIGYEYKQVEGGIEVQRVVVDSLVPTVIHLRHASERQAPRADAKPAPTTNKRNPAPKPDYWDP